jgi:hypothetical protein
MPRQFFATSALYAVAMVVVVLLLLPHRYVVFCLQCLALFVFARALGYFTKG